MEKFFNNERNELNHEKIFGDLINFKNNNKHEDNWHKHETPERQLGRIVVKGALDKTLEQALQKPRPHQPILRAIPVPRAQRSIPTLPANINGREIDDLPKTTPYLSSVANRILGVQSAFDHLRTVIDRVPQISPDDYIRYLLTSGLSVEVITGYHRFHKDVDLVLLHPDVNEHKDVFNRTDNVVSSEFWGGMNFDPRFLGQTAFRAYEEDVGEVMCVHPGITLVQKVSDAWGRAPREHDIHDATALAYWLLKQPEQRQKLDLSVVKMALGTLAYREFMRTADRLDTMFSNHSEIRTAIVPGRSAIPVPEQAAEQVPTWRQRLVAAFA